MIFSIVDRKALILSPSIWLLNCQQNIVAKIRQTVYEYEVYKLPLYIRCFNNFHLAGDN